MKSIITRLYDLKTHDGSVGQDRKIETRHKKRLRVIKKKVLICEKYIFRVFHGGRSAARHGLVGLCNGTLEQFFFFW